VVLRAGFLSGTRLRDIFFVGTSGISGSIFHLSRCLLNLAFRLIFRTLSLHTSITRPLASLPLRTALHIVYSTFNLRSSSACDFNNMVRVNSLGLPISCSRRAMLLSHVSFASMGNLGCLRLCIQKRLASRPLALRPLLNLT